LISDRLSMGFVEYMQKIVSLGSKATPTYELL